MILCTSSPPTRPSDTRTRCGRAGGVAALAGPPKLATPPSIPPSFPPATPPGMPPTTPSVNTGDGGGASLSSMGTFSGILVGVNVLYVGVGDALWSILASTCAGFVICEAGFAEAGAARGGGATNVVTNFGVGVGKLCV